MPLDPGGPTLVPGFLARWGVFQRRARQKGIGVEGPTQGFTSTSHPLSEPPKFRPDFSRVDLSVGLSYGES